MTYPSDIYKRHIHQTYIQDMYTAEMISVMQVMKDIQVYSLQDIYIRRIHETYTYNIYIRHIHKMCTSDIYIRQKQTYICTAEMISVMQVMKDIQVYSLQDIYIRRIHETYTYDIYIRNIHKMCTSDIYIRHKHKRQIHS